MEGKTYQYVVTAQKATVVTAAVTGSFTAPHDRNLIVAKNSRLEIHKMAADGLQPFLDVGVYGRVAAMRVFRPANAQQDLLFIATESYRFFVLRFDAEQEKIITCANGSLANPVGKQSENIFAVIEPQNRLIAFHLYSGLLQVIAVDADGHLSNEAPSMRLHELDVVDLCFLHAPADSPTLALLFKDRRSHCHLKTYKINLSTKELEDGPWPQMAVPAGAQSLMPVSKPFGGVVVIGDSRIVYVPKEGAAASGTNVHSISADGDVIEAWGVVDAYRYLLGAESGRLSVLVMNHNDEGKVIGMHKEVLGHVSSPRAICYLDNGFVFVGAHGGDSQIVRLNADAEQYIEIVEEFTNVGPIIDMEVIDMKRQGQGQLVTCSGVNGTGSLRVIRNGIAVTEDASVEMAGIKGLWSLRGSFDSPHDKYLVQSFVGETRLLGLTEEESLEEMSIEGFVSEAPTLFTANMNGNVFLQVTPTGARLVSATTLKFLVEWCPPEGSRISLAGANDRFVLVSIGGGNIVLLESTGDGELREVTKTQLAHEISCVDLTHQHAAVGLWTDISVRLLTLPSLQEIDSDEIGGDALARSLMFVEFDGVPHLLSGLGDGRLFTFVLESNGTKLTHKKEIVLGTKPITLSKFVRYSGRGDDDDEEEEEEEEEKKKEKMDIEADVPTTHVFAACDRPSILSPKKGGKYLLSNVNMSDLVYVTPFNSEVFPDCLSFATDEELIIGDIDGELQKLHVMSIELGEQPRRIAHQSSTQTLAVCTTKDVSAERKQQHQQQQQQQQQQGQDQEGKAPAAEVSTEVSFVRLLDDQTFDRLDGFELDPFEVPFAITSQRFLRFMPEQDNDEEGREDAGDRQQQQQQQPRRASMEVEEQLADKSERKDDDDADADVALTDNDFFVVGTAYAMPNESEPSSGRVLILRVDARKLVCVTSIRVKGAAYSVCPFGEGKLLVGVNNAVHLYRWVQGVHGDPTLELETQHHGGVLVMSVRARGDFVLVADLMRSLTLLAYKRTTGKLHLVARDFNANWMFSAHIMENETYLGSETWHNLFAMKRNTSSVSPDDRKRLEETGLFHLGDCVNVMRSGSLVALPGPDVEDAVRPSVLCGTVNGSIVVVATLSKAQFEFFSKIQKALQQTIQGVGGLSHDDWRNFKTNVNTSKHYNFIDGDLIESFLELQPETQEHIASVAQLPLEEVSRRIEDVARIH